MKLEKVRIEEGLKVDQQTTGAQQPVFRPLALIQWQGLFTNIKGQLLQDHSGLNNHYFLMLNISKYSKSLKNPNLPTGYRITLTRIFKWTSTYSKITDNCLPCTEHLGSRSWVFPFSFQFNSLASTANPKLKRSCLESQCLWSFILAPAAKLQVCFWRPCSDNACVPSLLSSAALSPGSDFIYHVAELKHQLKALNLKSPDVHSTIRWHKGMIFLLRYKLSPFSLGWAALSTFSHWVVTHATTVPIWMRNRDGGKGSGQQELWIIFPEPHALICFWESSPTWVVTVVTGIVLPFSHLLTAIWPRPGIQSGESTWCLAATSRWQKAGPPQGHCVRVQHIVFHLINCYNSF